MLVSSPVVLSLFVLSNRALQAPDVRLHVGIALLLSRLLPDLRLGHAKLLLIAMALPQQIRDADDDEQTSGPPQQTLDDSGDPQQGGLGGDPRQFENGVEILPGFVVDHQADQGSSTIAWINKGMFCPGRFVSLFTKLKRLKSGASFANEIPNPVIAS